MTTGFTKGERLLKRAEFTKISQQGYKLSSKNFLLISCRSDQGFSRIGITASRKVGNAVVRNRIKRLIREFFRLHKNFFPEADYNIIARTGASKLDYAKLAAELEQLLRRARTEHVN